MLSQKKRVMREASHGEMVRASSTLVAKLASKPTKA